MHLPVRRSTRVLPRSLLVAAYSVTAVGCIADSHLDSETEPVDTAQEEIASTAVPFTGSAQAYGSIQYVTCNSWYSCKVPSNWPGAIDCGSVTTKKDGSSRYWKPLMTADTTCANAINKTYTDATHIIVMPDKTSGVAFGQTLTVCWNNKCTGGVVYDLHDTTKAPAWEVNLGITNALGAPQGVTLSNVSITAGIPANVPTNLSPPNGSNVGSSVTLSWSPVYPGAISYKVYVYRWENGSWVFHNGFGTTKNTPNLTFYPYPKYWYYWRVSACNDVGCGNFTVSNPSFYANF